jgi:integrase
MASITRRVTAASDARYDVRLRIGERAVTRTFKRRQDADRRAKLTEADRALGGAVDPRSGAVHLGDDAKRWLSSRELAPRSRELYGHLNKRLIAPTFATTALARITPEAVRLWHSDLTSRAGALQAAKGYRLLRAVLNTAVADGLLLRNPCRIVGGGQEHTPERPLVTPEQVLALAEAIEPRYRALVLLAGNGGLRLGELLGLRRNNVDTAAATVRIEEQATHLMSGVRVVGPPKSATGKRTVVLPAITVEALNEHRDQYVGAGEEALVFTDPSGQPLHKDVLYKAWRSARAAVGLEHATIHDLRHAGATLAAWTGASTKELMARLGHASPRAALRYQHAAESRDREIAARLDDVFAAVRNPRPSSVAVPRDGRAMESDMQEAKVNEEGVDQGLHESG